MEIFIVYRWTEVEGGSSLTIGTATTQRATADSFVKERPNAGWLIKMADDGEEYPV